MDYLQYDDGNVYMDISANVLNLVINGLPSIPSNSTAREDASLCFKPCYKWITFNTLY